jgi:hypothetical protein
MKRLLQSSMMPLVGPLIEPGVEASTGPVPKTVLACVAALWLLGRRLG